MKRTMQTTPRAVAAILAAAACLMCAPRPAAADGAASTRNIIFGAAAATAGTLLIINQNRKVHEKYAEYDRQQAATQSEANQSQAAYESERQAYAHEATIVSEYRKQTQYQHAQIKQRESEIASLKHSLLVAKAASAHSRSAFAQQATVARPLARTAAAHTSTNAQQVASYGWGQF